VIPIRQHETNTKTETVNFAKMTRGMDVIDDAVIELEKFRKSKYRTSFADKDAIINALETNNTKFLREMSNYYVSISGIYSRFVKYLAGILTYSWYAYPYMPQENYNEKKVERELNGVIQYLDNLGIPITFYDISTKVIIDGAFYGYMINNPSKTLGTILELPVDYCRSRYKYNGMDAVEFNVKYFTEQIIDPEQRAIVLKNFPPEFNKNYQAYRAGVLKVDKMDGGAWFLCDLNLAMKFSLSTNDIPIFSSVTPTLINLDEAKQLDMKKTMQELLKIIIQKMPLDKNSEMVFDLDEAQAMHNNACRMLSNAVNVDVLTTFAEIDVADLDNANASSVKDPLQKVERGVFNEAGISQMLFATDGNIALEKSILNDESLMFYLLGQYQNKLNSIIEFLFNKKSTFKISMPNLSIYNLDRKEKMFKELATAGYSKLLPAITSGMSQSEFLSLNEYENKILKLNEKMVPLSISSTQSAGTGKVGAPTKDNPSEKTIQNKESQS